MSRTWDAGHRAVFARTGGYIRNATMGQTTQLYGADDVYRFGVSIAILALVRLLRACRARSDAPTG